MPTETQLQTHCREEAHQEGVEDSAGHIPVLSQEVLDLLNVTENGLYLDATFGGGGHTRAILEGAPHASVVAIDCDPDAERRSAEFVERYPGRFTFHRANFSVLAEINEGPFDGVLFDFGVSSFQLDSETRGFSFRTDAPLDMRLNPESGISAAEFLEQADQRQLVQAIRDYGEERQWRRVVSAIQDAQGSASLSNTASLAELIKEAIGGRVRNHRIHPATKSFQGIRIAVNNELGVIEAALPIAFQKLKKNGVLVAISFHSLEDRIVKRYFRKLSGQPEHAKDWRTQDERTRYAEPLTKRPLQAGEVELARNARSRSAKLRAVRRICDTFEFNQQEKEL